MNTQLNEAVASLMKSDRKAFAEMMTEYIQPNHLTEDYIGMLLNARTLKPGDSLSKRVRKGIKAYTFVNYQVARL